jgi:hypothetical protein
LLHMTEALVSICSLLDSQNLHCTSRPFSFMRKCGIGHHFKGHACLSGELFSRRVDKRYGPLHSLFGFAVWYSGLHTCRPVAALRRNVPRDTGVLLLNCDSEHTRRGRKVMRLGTVPSVRESHHIHLRISVAPSVPLDSITYRVQL